MRKRKDCIAISWRSAGACAQLKQEAEAEKFLDQVLASFRRKYGPEDRRTLVKIQNFAGLLSDSSRWQRGEALYREELAVLRKQPSADPVTLSMTLLGLGANLSKHDNPEEGEQLVRECLELSRKSLPQSHAYMVPLTESLLGDCLRRQGRFAEAEPLLLGAVPGIEAAKTLPPPYRIAAMERVLSLYDAWDKQDKADEWRKKWEEAKAAQKRVAKP
jgi:tetratricopeptide (TPR) repeat protein